MNYLEQQDYLRSHRRMGLFASMFLAICAILVLFLDHDARFVSKIIFITLGIGLLFLINYNPKYLYLNGIYPKRFFWAVRIRWVVCGLVLALGLINSQNISDVIVALIATVWLSVANVLARSWLKSGKMD